MKMLLQKAAINWLLENKLTFIGFEGKLEAYEQTKFEKFKHWIGCEIYQTFVSIVSKYFSNTGYVKVLFSHSNLRG